MIRYNTHTRQLLCSLRAPSTQNTILRTSSHTTTHQAGVMRLNYLKKVSRSVSIISDLLVRSNKPLNYWCCGCAVLWSATDPARDQKSHIALEIARERIKTKQESIAKSLHKYTYTSNTVQNVVGLPEVWGRLWRMAKGREGHLWNH